MRYFESPSLAAPASGRVALMLILMLLALLLAPSLVFATTVDGSDETLPRYTLSPAEIAVKVAEELKAAGYGEHIEASVHTDDPNTIFGADEPMNISIKSLQADAKARQWSANVVFEGEKRVLTALPMKGRFDEMVELPVLERTLSTGSIIEKDDVVLKMFPAHYQRAGVIHESQTMVGKSVRRNITKDRPVREHEVSLPIVAKKNDLINLNYNSARLSISTTGQLMADGAVGDVVEIKNINSDKTVRAVIKDSKTASVLPAVQTSSLSVGGSHEIN